MDVPFRAWALPITAILGTLLASLGHLHTPSPCEGGLVPAGRRPRHLLATTAACLARGRRHSLRSSALPGGPLSPELLTAPTTPSAEPVGAPSPR
jgi:hypothetical protein